MRQLLALTPPDPVAANLAADKGTETGIKIGAEIGTETGIKIGTDARSAIRTEMGSTTGVGLASE